MMIIKVPIYFGVEVNFDPKKVEEFISCCRSGLNDYLKANSGGSILEQSFEGKMFKLEILSDKQVRNRLTGPKQQKFSPKPPGV